MSEGVFEKLKNYDWPGNIRELENLILQAMIVGRGNVLDKENITIPQNAQTMEGISLTELTTLDEVEKVYIKHKR